MVDCQMKGMCSKYVLQVDMKCSQGPYWMRLYFPFSCNYTFVVCCVSCKIFFVPPADKPVP